MSMSIHKLRMKAKEDRGKACLQYLQTRIEPVTLKDLASKLDVTTKSISNSLVPLLKQGLVIRELMLRQSSICKKSGWAYGYTAVNNRKKKKTWLTNTALERELKKDEKARQQLEKKRLEEADKEPIMFHNPFGIKNESRPTLD